MLPFYPQNTHTARNHRTVEARREAGQGKWVRQTCLFTYHRDKKTGKSCHGGHEFRPKRPLLRTTVTQIPTFCVTVVFIYT